VATLVFLRNPQSAILIPQSPFPRLKSPLKGPLNLTLPIARMPSPTPSHAPAESGRN
jgi:hypothetical protein